MAKEYAPSSSTKAGEGGVDDLDMFKNDVNDDDLKPSNGDRPPPPPMTSSIDEDDGEDKKSSQSVSWPQLVTTYCGESTLHGIRYIVQSGSPLFRRFIWFCLLTLAFAFLITLFQTKLAYLRSYPKEINVNFDIEKRLPFPAVTICNERPFRLTALQSAGLYDLVVNDRDRLHEDSKVVGNIVHYHENDTYTQTSESLNWYNITPVLKNTTRAICRSVCSHVFGDECVGIQFNEADASCSWAYLTSPNPNHTQLVESVETYIRSTATFEKRDIFCDFEDWTYCPFDSFISSELQWVLVPSAAGDWDATFFTAGHGHVISVLSERDTEQFHLDDVRSMDTTGKCLEFFYWIDVTSPPNCDPLGSELSVISVETSQPRVILASLVRDFIDTVVSTTYIDFHRAFVHLENGVHRIRIHAKRSHQNACNVLLDGISLMDCQRFVYCFKPAVYNVDERHNNLHCTDAEKECLVHPAGRYYRGTANVSESGKKCLPWSMANDHIVFGLRESPLDAKNYCRFVFGQNLDAPVCLVDNDDGGTMVERCTISYCGALDSVQCRTDKLFKCPDGMCIPRNLKTGRLCDDNECLTYEQPVTPCNYIARYQKGGDTVKRSAETEANVKGNDEVTNRLQARPVAAQLQNITKNSTDDAQGRKANVGQSRNKLRHWAHWLLKPKRPQLYRKISDKTLACVFFEQTTTPCNYVSTGNNGVDWEMQQHPIFGRKLTATSDGQYGDIVTLTSAVTLPEMSVYSIRYIIENQHPSDDGASSLSAYELTPGGIPLGKIFESAPGPYNQPLMGHMCVPRRYMRLLLSADAGIPGYTTVHLDGIYRTRAATVCQNFTREGDLMTCDFKENDCGGILLATSSSVQIMRAFFITSDEFKRWKLKEDAYSQSPSWLKAWLRPSKAPKIFNKSSECGTLHYSDLNTVIESPNYPHGFVSNLNCRFIVHGKPGVIMQIQFQTYKNSSIGSGSYLLMYCANGTQWVQRHYDTSQKRTKPTEIDCSLLVLIFHASRNNDFSFRAQINMQQRAVATTGYVLRFQQMSVDVANVLRGTFFFPPIKLDEGQTVCLQMNFSTRAYFAVEILYEIGNELRHNLLFRTENMHDDNYHELMVTLDSTMSEGLPFALAFDSRTSEVGTLAIVRHLKIEPSRCPTEGLLPYVHQFCNNNTDIGVACVEFQQSFPVERRRWIRFKQGDKTVFGCEFQPDAYDTETQIVSPAIYIDSSSVSAIHMTYNISSADLDVTLYIMAKTPEASSSHRLLFDVNTFYALLPVETANGAIRLKIVARKSTNKVANEQTAASPGLVVITNIQIKRLQSTSIAELNNIDNVNCEFKTSKICGYVIGRQWRYSYPELIHLSNKHSDLYDNQLTSPKLQVRDGGQILEMWLTSDDPGLQMDVYIVNAIGLLNSEGKLHSYGKTLLIGEYGSIKMCLPSGEFQLAFILRSNETGRRHQIHEVRLHPERCPVISRQLEKLAKQDCRKSRKGTEYAGHISRTASGRTCQSWTAQYPHEHTHNDTTGFPDATLKDAANFCRNPDWSLLPWCYTMDPSKRWEYCNIPLCSELSSGECRTSKRAADYRGHTSTTVSGLTCQSWSSQVPHSHSHLTLYEETAEEANNYCRNPDNSPQPWCYTTDPDTRWEFCNIPMCAESATMECRQSIKGTEYVGHISSTISGRRCQSWASQSPHQHEFSDATSFPDASVADAADYCRNPNGAESPWCFTTDTDVRWEFCNVPMCSEMTSKDCQLSTKGTEYIGRVNVTVTGRTCQSWTSQYPHEHLYTEDEYFPDLSVANASNYCRNMGNSDGPWCFTTDPNMRWEYCYIPICTELASKDCDLYTKGTEYIGQVNTTISGRDCQPWTSQTPHEHNYMDPSKFPDDSLEDASNYCRNIDGADGPWCYTTDPKTRWEYCYTPVCTDVASDPYFVSHSAFSWICRNDQSLQFHGDDPTVKVNISYVRRGSFIVSSSVNYKMHIMYIISYVVPSTANLTVNFGTCQKLSITTMLPNRSHPTTVIHKPVHLKPVYQPEEYNISSANGVFKLIAKYEDCGLNSSTQIHYAITSLTGHSDACRTRVLLLMDNKTSVSEEPPAYWNSDVIQPNGSTVSSCFSMEAKFSVRARMTVKVFYTITGKSIHSAVLLNFTAEQPGTVLRENLDVRLENVSKYQECLNVNVQLVVTFTPYAVAYHVDLIETRKFELQQSQCPIDDGFVDTKTCNSSVRKGDCFFRDISNRTVSRWLKVTTMSRSTIDVIYKAEFGAETGQVSMVTAPIGSRYSGYHVQLTIGVLFASPSLFLQVSVIKNLTLGANGRYRFDLMYVAMETVAANKTYSLLLEPVFEGQRVMITADKRSLPTVTDKDIKIKISNIIMQFVEHQETPEVTTLIAPPTNKSYIDVLFEKHDKRGLYDVLQVNESHEKERFILKCKFGGAHCGPEAITPTRTTKGLCYTFNNHFNDSAISFLPGADYGLSLLINVERYEFVPSYGAETGAQIYLHEPGDTIGSSSGLAVAPGSQVLFDMSYNQFSSLPAPYGSCSDEQQLRFFSPETPYSVAKCRLECLTESLNQTCNCKEPYMPGKFSPCNVAKSLTCVMAWRENKAIHAAANCSCSRPCNEVKFDTVTSSLHLSDILVNSLLNESNEIGRSIQRQYALARQARSRVDSKPMLSVLANLNHLDDIACTLCDAINQTGTISRDSLSAVNAIIHLTAVDVYRFDTELIQELTNEYNSKIRPLIEPLIVSALSFDMTANRVWAEVGSSEKSFQEEMIEYVASEANSSGIVELIKTADTFCRYANFRSGNVNLQVSSNVSCENWTEVCHFISYIRSNISLLVDVYRETYEAHGLDQYSGFDEFVRDSFKQLSLLGRRYTGAVSDERSSQYIVTSLSTLGRQLARLVDPKTMYVSTVINCVSGRGDFIKMLNAWVAETKRINSSVLVNPLRRNSAFCSLPNRVNQLIMKLESETLDNFAIEFDMAGIELQLSLQRLLNDDLASMELEIVGAIHDARSKAERTLIELLQFSYRLIAYCEYVNVTCYDRIMKLDRHLFIWRQPTLGFDSIIQYHYDKGSDRNAWPRRVSETNFFERQKESLSILSTEIDGLLGKYFEQVENKFKLFRDKVTNLTKGVLDAVRNVDAELSEYRKSAIIDSDFIRSNLLKVTLYYGDFKSSIMTQSPAYGIETLFSDLGGYLGLLIGGSVLTVAEVVDLVIYNSVLKLLCCR